MGGKKGLRERQVGGEGDGGGAKQQVWNPIKVTVT